MVEELTGRRLSTVSLSDVAIDDDFWNDRLATNRETSLEHQYEQLGERCLPNFRRARDGKEGGFQGMCFEDSDAYKWLEAASYVLATRDDPELKERVDEVIELVAAAQEENGYLNTYHQLKFDDELRWSNLRNLHELYCAGHLIEAAVAHHRATGEDSLLQVASDFADHIDDTFGPDDLHGAPGHEEVELALVKLYRVTEEQRYLDLAEYFVDARGTSGRFDWETDHPDELAGGEWWHTGDDYDATYSQSHAPVREQDTVEGHSVRAVYLYSGVADLLLEGAGDAELAGALDSLWENMTEKRMYVTGGIGSTSDGERFTEDYDLPNRSAYAETCAAVGSVFWNRRLFELTGEGRFYDTLERALYNGVLAGVSQDGTEFFYENPLESLGHHHRKGWFACACCPPNLARLLASLGEYVYAQNAADEPYVNLLLGSEATLTVGGREMTLTQHTDYPWGESAEIEVGVDDELDTALHVRVPEWCANPELTVNGDAVESDRADGYLTVERSWEDGDTLELAFELPVKRMAAHPDLPDDADQLALQRGPLVYCVEETDLGEAPSRLRVDPEASVDVRNDEDLLGGVVTLAGEARAATADGWDGELYREWKGTDERTTAFTAVPYYGWDNREEGRMRVWLPTD